MKTTADRHDQEAMARLLASFHRLSWRQALGKVVSPALRLHHYRELHARTLYRALCLNDCHDDNCSGNCQ
jgi:hypothetical protein